LQADHRPRATRPGQLGHLFRFSQAVTQRPLAVDVLACLDRRDDKLKVRRHLDRHHGQIDVWRRDERLVSRECLGNAVMGCGGVGALLSGRADRVDLVARMQ